LIYLLIIKLQIEQRDQQERYQKEQREQEEQIYRQRKHDKIRHLMNEARYTKNYGIFSSLGISIGEVRQVYPNFNYNTMNLRG
jgi:hypothetical protein